MSKVKSEFSQEYYLYSLKTKTHYWVVVGGLGAVHIWARDGRKDCTDCCDFDNVYGGIEVHYGSAPNYRSSDNFDHPNCWVLGGPCWHDGSSLQFEENFCDTAGLADITNHNHEPFLRFAKMRYRQWLLEDA